MSISTTDLLPNDRDSDSDAGSDAGSDAPDDYQPISAVDSDPDDESSAAGPESNGGDLPGSSTPDLDQFSSNGPRLAADGVFHLRLDGREDVEEEEEEERRDAAELAISLAFREDEERRSAPLTQENASRVVEAMRGVVFPGVPPDWAGRVSEQRWLDQLRSMREPSASS